MRTAVANKKRHLIRKRKMDPGLTHRYLIEVKGSKGRKYEARIREFDEEYKIYDIRRIDAENSMKRCTISATIVDGTKRRRHLAMLIKKHYTERVSSEDILVGKRVIIHESTPQRVKTFVGKIVSALPKITGTPSGEGGLPPSDE